MIHCACLPALSQLLAGVYAYKNYTALHCVAATKLIYKTGGYALRRSCCDVCVPTAAKFHSAMMYIYDTWYITMRFIT